MVSSLPDFPPPCLIFEGRISVLYYKPMTNVNDDSRVVNKLEASLTDDTRVIIYDHNMFSVQATGANTLSGARKLLTALLTNIRLGWKLLLL
jgi:hypothetical protein